MILWAPLQQKGKLFVSFDLSVIPNKNIIVAVTGGIAAYKSAILVRRLKDAPLTFSSNNTECELGSAFCLYQNKTRTPFKVNLASLSQSQARVDPRVLLLAKSTEP